MCQALADPSATRTDSNYFTSVNDGIEDTKTKIQEYVAACGTASRIVLLGYSQGGNVMTDTLAGGTGKPDAIGDEYRPYSKYATVTLVVLRIGDAHIMQLKQSLSLGTQDSMPARLTVQVAVPAMEFSRATVVWQC